MASKMASSRKEPTVGLRPPQFHLRTLLLAMTGLAMLVAVARFWSLPVVVGVVFLLVSIGLHVAANALGMQLRRNRGRSARCDAIPAVPKNIRTSLPNSHLGRHHPLGTPIRVLTIGGIVVGAVGGCLGTWATHTARLGWENYLVAAIAFGVLGGMALFVTTSFLQVTFRAFRQAAGETTMDGSNRSAEE